MKNFCFSLLVAIGLFFSSISSISAQPYESYFGDSTTKWSVLFDFSYALFCSYHFSSFDIVYKGDSVYAGITYKKMVANTSLETVYLFREDTTTGELFILENFPQIEEKICSNMSLTEQDSIVEQIYYSNGRKHIKLKTRITEDARWKIDTYNIVLIEGVGASSVIILSNMNNPDPIGEPILLLCAEKDGVEVYKHNFPDLPNTCELDTSDCYDLSVTEFGYKKSAFNLFPNPNSGVFNLQFQDDISLNNQVAIFDLMGKMVFQSSFNGNSQSIDANHLPNGVYFIQIKNSESSQILGTERLIINK